MKRLLRFLWTGSWHEHSWKIEMKGELRSVFQSDNSQPYAHQYVLRCEHCGEMKCFRTS